MDTSRRNKKIKKEKRRGGKKKGLHKVSRWISSKSYKNKKFEKKKDKF